MALTLLLKDYLTNSGRDNVKLTALTVNHNLRAESSAEISKIQEWMKNRKINHEVLTWEHDELTTAVEEKARAARYQLLTEYCLANDIKVLLTAHHAMDQIETLFMRLLRGSSLKGLCSMRSKSVCNNVVIGRPLLSIFPDELKSLLAKRFSQQYIVDPSNFSEQFERNRVRKLLEKTDVSNVINSIEELQKIDEQVYSAAGEFINTRVTFDAGTFIFKKADLLALLPFVAQNVLYELLKRCNSANLSTLSFYAAEKLYEKVISPDFRGSTVFGCLVKRKSNGCLLACREVRPRL
jgi:tRNA(Ile)-lysidine synthase